MSSDKNKNEPSRGSRLKEERIRIGKKSKELAELGGVTPKTQGLYERDDESARDPDGEYFNRIAESGIDVQYVITSIKAKPVVPMFDTDGKEIELGDFTAEEFSSAMLLVLDAADEMNLNIRKPQIMVLTEHALEQACTKDELKAWIKTTYAMAGVELPDEK